MERTVPSTASEEIELYLRTYYSLLRSTSEVQIRTLEEAHARMNSLLHPNARDLSPDISAFIYTLQRLPECMPAVNLIVLGQSPAVFQKGGYGNIEEWPPVSSIARRRRCFYDGEEALACFIASRTDIDDVIPLLTAYQIEWNKLHNSISQLPASYSLEDLEKLVQSGDHRALQDFADALNISRGDLNRLRTVLGNRLINYLNDIEEKPLDLRVRLLSGSLSEYWRATRLWWENIQAACPQLQDNPVYFVSSNPHSLANLVTGYALSLRSDLIEFLEEPHNSELLEEWEQIQAREVPSSEENFLYYILKKYQQAANSNSIMRDLLEHEKACGILRVPSEHSFDVEAQVISLNKLRSACMDNRLGEDLQDLDNSDALILNIDYPLGLSAYNILSKVAEHAGEILGVYILGKAATLNGVIGDVMIPNVVHDEQSQNTYIFANSFTSDDVSEYLVYGTVLDNQKAVTVRGTFLQNDRYMDVFYREGYTDIEMEAGPYLSAVYEMYRPQRHPSNEIVNLYGLPFDLGIIHYASDTPFGRGKNLGAGTLSYYGMDSTYAASIAILRRIFYLERQRLQGRRNPFG
jgi:hypothetical protein